MQTTTQREAVKQGDLPGAQGMDAIRDTVEHPAIASVAPKICKVLVGIPLKGHTPPASYHDRMLMFQYLGERQMKDQLDNAPVQYQFGLGAIGEILVPYAREELAKSAMALGCEYLFMIDDDMLGPPDLFYKLVRHDKDIIAPLAFTRNPDHKPVIYEVLDGFDPTTKEPYYQKRFVMNYPRNSLVECDAVGFGAVLIKVDVLRKMSTPRFMGMQECGEDITFCYKAKKLGFHIFMDTSVKLGHLGAPTVITEDYADKWVKLTPDEREKVYGQYTTYPSMELA